MTPGTLFPAIAVLLTTTALVSACAPAVPAAADTPEPQYSACQNSGYLRLRAVEPDSLSEREWVRLQQLEDLCLAEWRATAGRADSAPEPARPARMHYARWLWMPAMMVLGGLTWLLMAT